MGRGFFLDITADVDMFLLEVTVGLAAVSVFFRINCEILTSTHLVLLCFLGRTQRDGYDIQDKCTNIYWTDGRLCMRERD